MISNMTYDMSDQFVSVTPWCTVVARPGLPVAQLNG